MDLVEYQRRIARGDYRSKCSWCWGVDTGSRFNCVCDKDCGRGICPAEVETFEAPEVPRFA